MQIALEARRSEYDKLNASQRQVMSGSGMMPHRPGSQNKNKGFGSGRR